jgi:hypothetical protein
LDEIDILDGGDLDGLFVVVKPGVSVTEIVLAMERRWERRVIPAR